MTGRGDKRLLMEDWYRGFDPDTTSSWPTVSRRVGSGISTTTTGSPPPRGKPTCQCQHPGSRWKTTLTPRFGSNSMVGKPEGIRFLGHDGPRRFAVTRSEAEAALDDFLDNRLTLFGPYEDAVLWRDPFMAHSLLSVPLNLGLLHPAEVVARAEERWRADQATLASVEGLIRQIIGWREYVWHLYWHLGESYELRNELDNTVEPPTWFLEASVEEVDAACLRHSLGYVRDLGYSHHIVRLMVLSNWALQRGYSPQVMNDWFRRAFVDGYPWVMTANVIGMGLYADGGEMATKPYVSGGAYLKRMTDFCGDCVYDPKLRVGRRHAPSRPATGHSWTISGNVEITDSPPPFEPSTSCRIELHWWSRNVCADIRLLDGYLDSCSCLGCCRCGGRCHQRRGGLGNPHHLQHVVGGGGSTSCGEWNKHHGSVSRKFRLGLRISAPNCAIA